MICPFCGESARMDEGAIYRTSAYGVEFCVRGAAAILCENQRCKRGDTHIFLKRVDGLLDSVSALLFHISRLVRAGVSAAPNAEHCHDCGAKMDLSVRQYHFEKHGVQVTIDNVPGWLCE